jgi:hypothetical protein
MIDLSESPAASETLTTEFAAMNFGAAVLSSGTTLTFGGLSGFVQPQVSAGSYALFVAAEPAPLPRMRHAHTTAVLNDIVYLVGGTDRFSANMGESAAVYRFYPGGEL